eukprot:414937-Hanusia_phi.AAC.6
MSWYPIGRPVGTTIYPGMQITSVVIWKVLPWFGINMSLNDVCVYVPAWFGVVATTFLALLTWECAGFMAAGTAAALFMSIIPAHIMRSVAGGYDNESVAITAMCMTFFFWCRSLRDDNSWWIGAFAGLAYVYMVRPRRASCGRDSGPHARADRSWSGEDTSSFSTWSELMPLPSCSPAASHRSCIEHTRSSIPSEQQEPPEFLWWAGRR